MCISLFVCGLYTKNFNNSVDFINVFVYKLPIKGLFLNYYLFYESWVLITLPIVDTIASYEFEIQVTKSILF